MYRSLLITNPSWAPIPLRLALGVTFILHGSQKVFGAFGGRGFEAWMSGPAPLGLQPPKLWLAAAAFSELLGGILVFVGLLTRFAAFMLACVMFVAIYGVHLRNGFFMRDNGFEFPLALFAICLALMITGGGRASIDSNI